MLKIIHFDLGSNMAFAHNGCEEVVVTERKTFVGSRQERAAATLEWIVKRFGEMKKAGIKFDVVHYERPFARGFDATRCGWGLAGIIEAAAGHNTVVLDTTPQSIKSFALGSKKIARKKMESSERRKAAADEKLLMIARAQELGYPGDDEHEADAFMGLKYAEHYCQRTEGKIK